MFTGIVEDRVQVVEAGPGRLRIAGSGVTAGLEPGASIAVNGVCLTLVERGPSGCSFDLSEETLARSTLGALEAGDLVNLERPVTLASVLGGHLVQGHVDGVGRVGSARSDAVGGVVMRIDLPPDLMGYVVEKGSLAIDGVSLTVASVHPDGVDVSLIPHTVSVTTLGTLQPGDEVNVEVDVVARYVDRWMAHRARLGREEGGDR